MKICQYNIFFGDHPGIHINERMMNVCKCILEQNADIICLQEVLSIMRDQIIKFFSKTHRYVYYDRGYNHDSNSDSNNNLIPTSISTYDTMIFSRYPITKATTHHFDMTSMQRNIKLVLITDDSLNQYYICTSHFESEFKNGCTNKIYQYNRCADILYQLHQKTFIPIILCADTNICSITKQSFHEIFSYVKGWRDAWVENGSPITDEITFNPNTNPLLMKRYSGMDNTLKQKYVSRLDRILHMSKMHTIDFKIFGTDPNIILSDHYGIMCTISNKKPDFREDYISPVIPPPVIPFINKRKLYTKKLF